MNLSSGNMTNIQPTQNDRSSLSSLAARAQRTTAGDVENQVTEPGRWLDAADAIYRHYETLSMSGNLAEAERYLAQAYDLFNNVGLRGPCRIAIGALAELALRDGPRAAFDSRAIAELTKPFPVSLGDEPFLQATFAAHELQAWAAVARHALAQDPALAADLSKFLGSLLHSISVRWREAPERTLELILSAADHLSFLSSWAPAAVGSEAARISIAASYVAVMVDVLKRRPDLSQEPDESALRPLTYSPQAALEEYMDLSFSDRAAALHSCIERGDEQQFLQLGLEVSGYLGSLFALAGSPHLIQEPFLDAVAMMADCWRGMWGLPVGAKDALLDHQSRVCTNLVAGVLLAAPTMTEVSAVESFAKNLSRFLESAQVRASKPTPSGLAAFKLALGRLWERVSELDQDRDAALEALEANIDACRLLAQQNCSPRHLLVDAVAAASRLRAVRSLEPMESGYLELALGNLAFRSSDWRAARAHFQAAGKHLKDEAQDPHCLGVQNVAISAARAFDGAAETSLRLGDREAQISFLRQAVKVIEEVAANFKVEAARQSLLMRAVKYRGKLHAAQQETGKDH